MGTPQGKAILTVISLFFWPTQLCSKKDRCAKTVGSVWKEGQKHQYYATSPYLLGSKWPYRCHHLPGRSGIPAKSACWETRSPSSPVQRGNKASVVTAGRCMCGIFTTRLIKCVTTQDWRFKEKNLSACCSHVHHSDISEFWRWQRSFSGGSSDAAEATENKPKQEGSASSPAAHRAGEWKSALSTCRIWILHVRMSRLSLFLSLSEKQTTLSDTLRL